MSEDDFFEFCAANRDLRIERTAEGDILIMPPTGEATGDSNAEITTQLRIWAKRDKTGRVFDSSTGFILPNGALYSPDASWVLETRLKKPDKEDREGFAHVCPDFVIELRSRSDSVSFLRRKMEEYIENGARLAWLIDRRRRRVHIYRPNCAVSTLENAASVSADPELPGFALDLTEIWG